MKSKWITLIDKNGGARHKNIIGNDEKYFLNLKVVSVEQKKEWVCICVEG